MVAMIALAILVSLAIPGFSRITKEVHRSKAREFLLNLANQQETYYANNFRYANHIQLGYLGGIMTDGGHYKISISLYDDNSAYRMIAIPQEKQAKDEVCGSLTLNNVGKRGVENSILSDHEAFLRCWP